MPNPKTDRELARIRPKTHTVKTLKNLENNLPEYGQEITWNMLAATILDECIAYIENPSPAAPLPEILKSLRILKHGTPAANTDDSFSKLTPEIQAALHSCVVQELDSRLPDAVRKVITYKDHKKNNE